MAAVAGVALATTAVANGAPIVTPVAVSPADWDDVPSAGVLWKQSGFSPPLDGPALIQTRPVNTTGAWATRAVRHGPLYDGTTGVVDVPVGDLEGEFDVQLAIDGVAPTPLGRLRFDRSPPAALQVQLPPSNGVVRAAWLQRDAGSGTDPDAPTVAEINAAPDGGVAGAWRAFDQQPERGDGPRVALTGADDLADGRHVVRVRSRDRLGHEGAAQLGALVLDRQAPAIDAPREGERADPRSVTIGLIAPVADRGLAGLARVTVAPAGSDDAVDWWGGFPASAGGALTLTVPGPGDHTLVVRAWDAAGNRSESAPVTVRVLSEAEYAAAHPPRAVVPTPNEPGPRAGRPANAAVRAAWSSAVRFHHRRAGPRPAGTPRIVASPAAWRALLGPERAARLGGYATVDGRVFLGPTATAGLGSLRRARAARRATRPPSRADLDRMVAGLAVVLHESLHVSGAAADPTDLRTEPGRALEEALTEAATVDLLGRYVASLPVSRPLKARLRAAVRRYRPAYRPQVVWLRRVSARATGRSATAPVTAAWRVGAADRLRPGGWDVLAPGLGPGLPPARAALPPLPVER